MDTPRLHRPLILILIGFLTSLQGHGQTTGPGCKPPYYKGNYGPPLDGNISLLSTTSAPDGCTYIGSMYSPDYSIIKLDTFGSVIRSTAYIPSGALSGLYGGKAILDYDGNLLSVLFNNYILKTDTLGNVLSTLQLDLSNNPFISFVDVSVLDNGDKVFLYLGSFSAYRDVLMLVTSPDMSTIKWSKHLSGWTYLYASAAMVTDGNNIILGVDFYGSGYNNYLPGSGIIQLDGGTGTVLQQHWFSQILNFTHIASYSDGYIFNGRTNDANFPSFYIRTNKNLDLISANYFPSYTTGYPFGYPFLFQPQPDGSIYGFYSNTVGMTLFFITPDDAIQWASGLFGFYQNPVTLLLAPAGVFIGTDYHANDVITGGPISGIQLYRSSYSGYFPPCTNPTTATMSMTAYPLTAIATLTPIRDTTGVRIGASSIQEVTGPTLVGYTCTGTPPCSSLKLAGNPAICTGNGNFSANLNSGCPLPVTWSVSDGPGRANITPGSNNTVSVSFSQDGAYKVKAAFTANCNLYADSMEVNVTTTTAHLSLGDDTTLCSGTSLVLHAGNNFNTYAWQDGSTDSTLKVTAPGRYTVNAQDYCGNTYNSSVSVGYWPALSSPYPSSVNKCLIDTLSLPLPAGFDSVYFPSPPSDGRIRHDSVEFFNSSNSTFILEVRDDHGCQVGSNIAVQIYAQPSISIGSDITICPGDSIRLDPGPGLGNYQWSTDSRSQSIWATKGTYWVQTVTAEGCVDRASMVLSNYPAPVVNLDADTVLCAGTTRQLSAGDGFVSYLWDDGSTGSTLTIGSLGKYWVDVTDAHGCSTADTVKIKAIMPPPANFLPADTTICQYGSEILKTNVSFRSYLWSNDSTTASISVKSPGLYYLQVTDKYGCVGSDSIVLTGRQCLVGCFVPNAFTPNADGKNDLFRPMLFGEVVKYKFVIFNRWGQQVFESTKPSSGWDGTIQGVLQPAGAFVWYCIYQLQGEPEQMQKGTVLLIR